MINTATFERKMNAIAVRLRRKILVRAGNAGSRILLAAIRSATPVRTGLLRKSTGRKVKVYGSGTVLWFAVGPRRGFAQGEGKKKVDPVRYGHLADRRRPFRDSAAGGVKQAVLDDIENVLKSELANI